MDTRTREQRRRIMQSIGTENTGPERIVRRALHVRGYRYRLHRRDLPGTPDLVFPSRRKAIFVHGCFWHAHGCRYGRAPKSRREYWLPKLEANKKRDARAVRLLRRQGWTVLTVWQCETRELERLMGKIAAFLDGDRRMDRQRKPDPLRLATRSSASAPRRNRTR